MLKHRLYDRSYTCRPPDAFSDWTQHTAQKGAESNGYRVVWGQVIGPDRWMSHSNKTERCQDSFTMVDAQTPAIRLCTRIVGDSPTCYCVWIGLWHVAAVCGL